MSFDFNDPIPKRLREALADAAVDEGAWDEVHREASVTFGTDLCHTLCIDPRTGEFTKNRIYGDPEAERKFLGVADIAEPVHYAVTNPQVGLFRDADFISERDMDASPFYEAAGKNGARHRIVLRLIDEPDFYSCLSLLRGDGRPAFTAEEKHRFGCMAAAFQTAAELNRSLSGSAETARRLTEVLDAAGTIAFILDRNLRIVSVSAEGERFFARTGLLRISQGQLEIPRGAVGRERLALLIRDALSGDCAFDGGQCFLREQGGYAVARAHVARMPPATPLFHRPEWLALVTVKDPEQPVELSEPALREGFGLTLAEAAVARLLREGHSLREIAACRGTSYDTVKDQVKNVHFKSGQSEKFKFI